MTKRAAIIEEARTWIDTPFQHQARLKRVGIDCIGLPLCAARAAGIDITDGPVDYPRHPTPERTLALLREHMDEIPVADARVADLLFVWFEKSADGSGGFETLPSHFLLLSGGGNAIHAFDSTTREQGRRWRSSAAGRAVETRIPVAWLEQVHSAWRFRGLED